MCHRLSVLSLDNEVLSYRGISDAVASLCPVDRVAVVLASDKDPCSVQLLLDTVKFGLSKRLFKHMTSLDALGSYCV